MSKETTVKDALLEIYTEEIPASFLPPALSQAKGLAEKLLVEHRLSFKSVKTLGTPRRIAVLFEGLPERTPEISEEITGPSEKVAFDENKKPTRAALGFLKNYNASPEDLKIKETPKGKYVYLLKVTPGAETKKILPEVFEKIIRGISFRKSMVWEQSRFQFARPIRNLLAVYDGKPVRFSVAGIKACAATYGLYVLTSKRIKITDPQKYVSTLRNNCIMVDPLQRSETIKQLSEQALNQINGKQSRPGAGQAVKKISKLQPQLGLNDELLDEINYLVESPVALLCSFSEKYLNLPKEALENCIKKQKFIPVYSGGKLLNYFVGIRNGVSEHQDIVREGYQRVLAARLADVEYFYKRDSSVRFEEFVPKLAGVMFQEKIGTVLEKVNRVDEIAMWVAAQMRKSYPQITGETIQDVSRTAVLCKADLLTNLVFEYPELQGAAGRIYAEFSREKKEVAKGIEEHLWPLTAQGELPSTITGIAVSLSDKIDTLTADFAVGLIPTGSADPYALRRQAAGILRIIIEKNVDLSLNQLASKPLGLLPGNIVQDKQKIIDLLLDFFRQRLETIFEEKGFKFDEIRAVLAAGFDRPIDALKRLEALSAIRKESDFEVLLTGYKRAANIVKQSRPGAGQKKFDFSAGGAVDEAKLVEPEEKALYEKTVNTENEIKPFLENKDYPAVLARLVTLCSPIDLFFDKVMVMAQDPAIRSNRLSLLNKIVNLFLQVGDISLLQ